MDVVLELYALAGKELLDIAREEPEPHLDALLVCIAFPVQGPLLASAIAGGIEVGSVCTLCRGGGRGGGGGC